MPDEFSYDPLRDEFTIYGVRYAGILFREMGFSPPGSIFQIVERNGGMLTLRSITTELDARAVLKACQERERAMRAAFAAQPPDPMHGPR